MYLEYIRHLPNGRVRSRLLIFPAIAKMPYAPINRIYTTVAIWMQWLPALNAKEPFNQIALRTGVC